VEPALETAPTVAAVPTPSALRPRRQTRTFAGDLARLRNAVRAWFTALSPRVRALLAAGVLAAVALLILAMVLRDSPGGTRPAQQGQIGPSSQEAAAQNSPRPPRTLQNGDRSTAVSDLQVALTALGFYSEPIDGVFGDSTGAAVLAFQQEQGLMADAVAGPLTIEALVEALAAGAVSDAEVIKDGLAAAASAGRLSPDSAERYSGEVDDMLAKLNSLPPGRVPTLVLVFDGVAALAPDFNEPRALTLISMLAANADYLARRSPPEERVMEGADGMVYRSVPGRGFQFHPIAVFAHLNKLVRSGKEDDVRRLADGLVARGVHAGRSLLWEYYFPFGGPSRWTSGFAQAIAAQALARSADLLHDPKLADAARAAFRGISRGLWLEVAGGLWVREYGYTDMPILNAQLQSIVSLREYIEITGDEAARAAVERMDAATRAVLSQFDTGCWSRYSLGGSPASVHYHEYHVTLLKQLAAQTGDPLWSSTAARWGDYLAAGQC
jgi:peptidoglycan hydrolase-like protein with peptidoglycan-binding domain